MKVKPSHTPIPHCKSHKITKTVLSQNELYTYLGIWLVPSQNWPNNKKSSCSKKIKNSKHSLTTIAHINTIKYKDPQHNYLPKHIKDAFYAAPFSIPNIKKLDKLLINLTKSICNIPKYSPDILARLPHKTFGSESLCLLPIYVITLSKHLTHTLNDLGRLCQIYHGIFEIYSQQIWWSWTPPTIKILSVL